MVLGGVVYTWLFGYGGSLWKQHIYSRWRSRPKVDACEGTSIPGEEACAVFPCKGMLSMVHMKQAPYKTRTRTTMSYSEYACVAVPCAGYPSSPWLPFTARSHGEADYVGAPGH